MSTSKFIIDFWGDITCPFCYLGEHVLQRALSSFEHRDVVEFRWRSCLLHPDWEVGKSMTWNEFMGDVTSSEEKYIFKQKESILKTLSHRYQLNYNLPNAFSHNSINAARLLKLANTKGKSLEIALAFGAGYFEEALDLSKFEFLREKAASIGLASLELDDVLCSDRFLDEVHKDQEEALVYAYNYVPSIYFNGALVQEGLVDERKITDALHHMI